MSAKSFVYALVLLIVPLAVSAEVRHASDRTPELGARAVQNGSAAVFYSLPGSVLDGREHRLDVVVTENLTETARESLTFSVGDDVWRPVVEILPSHSQLLGERLQGHHADARVAIELDGGLLDERSLSELAERSRDLEGGDLEPVDIHLHPELTTVRAKVTPYACVYQCDQAALTCDDNCLRNPNPLCETSCDNRYHNCLLSCGCPVAIRELWVTTTYLGYIPGNRVCLFDGNEGTPITQGHYYDRRIEKFKNEHYVDVVQCDGTHTVALGSVDYPLVNCVKRVTSLPYACTSQAVLGGEAICSH